MVWELSMDLLLSFFDQVTVLLISFLSNDFIVAVVTFAIFTGIVLLFKRILRGWSIW